MAEKFVFLDLAFRAGAHLWSNPKLRGTPAEIPIILARPTLFDVVQLAQRYPLETLYRANRRLRATREISERQFLRTQEILSNIQRAKNDGALSCEDCVTAVTVGYEDPPREERTSTPAQRHCSLANWLPG